MSVDILTKRQQILTQRLEVLCNRGATEILPLYIEEIWGFGSFFRRKQRPNDIDLGLKLGRNEDANQLWQGFNDLMGSTINYAEGRRDEFPTPSDALHAMLQTSGGDKLWKTFSKWVAEMKWSVIDRESYRFLGPHQPYHADQIAVRILTRGLPGISIPEFTNVDDDFPLLTEALTLIWSRTKPNVRANLASAFASDSLRTNLMVELEGFDGQLSEARFEANVKGGLFKYALPLENPTFPSGENNSPQEKWLVSKALELFPHLDPAKVEDFLTTGYKPSKTAQVKPRSTENELVYVKMSIPELQSLAETKRTEIKETKWEAAVAKEALDTLIAWKTRTLQGDSYLAGLSAEEWVAESVLNAFDKKPTIERYVRAALRKLGLPEEKVLFEKSQGQYAIATTADAHEEISGRNRRVEAERKFSRVARREAKKFSARLNANVQVDDELCARSVYLHYSVNSENRGENSANETKMLLERGFKVYENDWNTSADFHLPLKGQKDPKEAASEVRNLLFGEKR